jgi:two-component system phosphate regulon sensor histidine kinase PhoR
VSLGLVLVVIRLFWVVMRLAQWLDRPGTPIAGRYAGGWVGHLGQRLRRAHSAQRRRDRRWLRLIREYRRAADALPDAIVALDQHHRILGFNPAARQQLGLRQRDVGLPVEHLLRHPEFISYLRMQDWSHDVDVESDHVIGQVLSVQMVPYVQGRLLLIARDVTRLQRLQAMRQDFVANVSHELRTPLTVLSGYIETLLDSEPGMEDELPSGLTRILNHMHLQSERMRRIVEDLLLLSRLETTSPNEEQFEQVQVPTMLESIAEYAEHLSGEGAHQIVRKITPQLRMRGVTRELDSLFSNLVFNAVKYTQPGGTINIRWFMDARGLVFEVQDTGIGIAPQHIPRLTERFYRVDVGRSRTMGGTGLGLAIVKHVMLRHHGRLDIESQPGQGSLFRCVFPPTMLAGKPN